MVEAQGVQPPFFYNVVHGCPIVGVGARRQVRDYVGKQTHAVEVTEQETRVRMHAAQRRRDRELARQEAAGSGGVHYKVGPHGLQ